MQTYARWVGIVLRASGFLVITAGAASASPVTSCGQVVTGGGDLVATLNCTAYPGDAVTLSGRLRLNGFTLNGPSGYDTVRCVGSCTIDGGTGAPLAGVIMGGATGVRGDRKVTLRGVRVTQSLGEGVRTDGNVRASRSQIDVNLGGAGIRSSANVRLVETSIFNNRSGVEADGRVKAKDSAVDFNLRDGILAAAIVLKGGGAAANGIDTDYCTANGCYDLVSDTAPRLLAGAVCLTSHNPADGTWGICQDD